MTKKTKGFVIALSAVAGATAAAVLALVFGFPAYRASVRNHWRADVIGEIHHLGATTQQPCA